MSRRTASTRRLAFPNRCRGIPLYFRKRRVRRFLMRFCKRQLHKVCRQSVMPFGSERVGPRVIQTGAKEFRVHGATNEQVRLATKDALRNYGPVMEGPLPTPVKIATAAMVGMVTRNVFDERQGEYGKEHLLGSSLYSTKLR